MDLIKNIYKDLKYDPKLFKEDQDIVMELIRMVDRIKDISKLNKETLADLFFEASGHGQEAGFIIGFRYAIMLMAECII